MPLQPSNPRKEKILYLIPTLASGGTERQAAELVRRLDRERFEPLVAVVYGLDRVPVEIPLQDARLISLRKPLGKLGALVVVFRLWRLILRERPAVVQSYLRPADLYARIAGVLAGHRRIVTSLRTRIANFYPPLWQTAERILWRFSARIVSNSQASAREAHDLLGIPSARIEIIPNGVDLERFQPNLDWRAPRAAFGLTPSDLVFGMVARYSPVKDHATLLTAVAQMAHSGSWPAFARLILVGRNHLYGRPNEGGGSNPRAGVGGNRPADGRDQKRGAGVRRAGLADPAFPFRRISQFGSRSHGLRKTGHPFRRRQRGGDRGGRGNRLSFSGGRRADADHLPAKSDRNPARAARGDGARSPFDGRRTIFHAAHGA